MGITEIMPGFGMGEENELGDDGEEEEDVEDEEKDDDGFESE